MKYIAVEGNIGAGKTTLAKIITQRLDALFMPEEFEDNPFLDRFYNNREQYALQVELSFLADRYKQMLKYFPSEDLFHDTIVSDYVIQKCSVFATNNLVGEEYDLFQRMYAIVEDVAPQPDLIIHLHRPVEILLEQIKKRGRPYESSLSAEYLKDIEQRYAAQYKTLQTPLLIVDVNDKDFESNPEILEALWTCIGKDKLSKRAYLSL